MDFLIGLMSLILGYLLGSIPFGVVIGKVFFHKDIRNEGSKNSGGTNAGRILGKKIGLIVIILDLLKCLISVWLTYFIVKYLFKSIDLFLTPTYFAYIAGLGACLGHTFPIFASFKGGKAVACYAGLVLSLNWGLAIGGFILYMIILKISKYVSLTSIITTLVVGLVSFIPIFKYTMCFGLEFDFILGIYLTLLAIYILIRHHSNVNRLLNHQEKKITWM